MGAGSAEEDRLALVEQAIMQVGWLGQRQFMLLLAEERFDLTVPQFHTLMYLAHYDGDCRMSDLAKATHQSAASLTGVVDRLLEKHLVARVRPEGDRRQVVVTATDQGRSLLVAIKQARRTAIRESLAHMQPSEQDDLVRLLQIVLDGMRQFVQSSERKKAHE